MIIQRTQTYPGLQSGFLCVGQATASTGVLTITFTGADVSSKITGISFTPVNNSATQPAIVQVTSIAYSAGVTTILARVFIGNQLATTTFSLTNSLVVHYSFWVNDVALPTNQTTNDSTKQEYV